MSHPRTKLGVRTDLALLASGHFMSDVYASFLVTLLPLWVTQFSLPLAAAGFLVSLRSVATTVGGPAGGYLADSTDRLLSPLGLLILALAMSAVGLAPSYLVLVVLVLLATAGGSLFGPQATSMAAQVSGHRRGFGVGIFLAGGALGASLGPIAVATLVSAAGIRATWVMVLPGVLVCVLFYRRFAPRARRSQTTRMSFDVLGALRSGPVVALAGVLVLKGAAETGIMTFLPILVAEKGGTLIAAGATISLFKLSGAAAAIFAGFQSDRRSWKPFMILAFVLAAVFANSFLRLEGLVALLSLVLLGATLLSSTSYTLVLAQNLMPGRGSTATGLVFSLSLLGGAAGALAAGFLADGLGLEQALLILGTGLPLGAAACSLGVRENASDSFEVGP